jgi:hypothetical protein
MRKDVLYAVFVRKGYEQEMVASTFFILLGVSRVTLYWEVSIPRVSIPKSSSYSCGSESRTPSLWLWAKRTTVIQTRRPYYNTDLTDGLESPIIGISGGVMLDYFARCSFCPHGDLGRWCPKYFFELNNSPNHLLTGSHSNEWFWCSWLVEHRIGQKKPREGLFQ